MALLIKHHFLLYDVIILLDISLSRYKVNKYVFSNRVWHFESLKHPTREEDITDIYI